MIRPQAESIAIDKRDVSTNRTRNENTEWQPQRCREVPAEEEVSLRLLRRLASTVRHQQYRGMDVVTVRVAAAAGGGEA